MYFCDEYIYNLINMVFEVSSIENWKRITEEILPLIKKKILLLKGNLGVGKTTFTKCLLEKMGSEEEVNSPTYSLVNEYFTPNGKVFHFDLYRINDLEELFDVGIEEYIESGLLTIIEWPDIYEKELLEMDFHVMEIENNDGIRKVSFI